VTVLRVAGEVERAGLRAYLDRLLRLDDRAAVRLQTRGAVLGVWGGPPLDVVSLRPVGLAEPPQPAVDVTVSARRLLESVDRVGPLDGGAVEVPAAVPGPSWAGLLPPRAGWSTLAVVPTAAVYDAVRVGIDGFRRRVDALPPDDRTTEAMTAVAQQLWDGPVAGGVPLRAAHAAELVGLLGREGEVTGYEAGPWVRLQCGGGSVALRRDGGTGLGLDLGVWVLGRA
jgi:hypothetical protein